MKTRQAIYKDCQKCDEPPNCGVAPERCNIQVEVIEVGDVVDGPCGGDMECEVLKLGAQQSRLGLTGKGMICCCTEFLTKDLTFRKGPKVHTFKGMGIVTGNQIHGKDIGSMVEGTGIFALSNNGKTYKVTLTEEKVEP
ncbi:hypothetical protein LCGC14_1237750 [marine sediment metagenome]|uniref:Uncharacterized protein n=1 Tax=marine sediment metagenome TaxID=412755 RepID=A0A0F9NNW2_9ZZZZ